MFTRSFSIAGALLLGAAPLAAQTTTAPTPSAGQKQTVNPNDAVDPVPAPLSGKPAPADVHETKPAMEPSAVPPAMEDQSGNASKPQRAHRPK